MSGRESAIKPTFLIPAALLETSVISASIIVFISLSIWGGSVIRYPTTVLGSNLVVLTNIRAWETFCICTWPCILHRNRCKRHMVMFGGTSLEKSNLSIRVAWGIREQT